VLFGVDDANSVVCVRGGVVGLTQLRHLGRGFGVQGVFGGVCGVVVACAAFLDLVHLVDHAHGGGIVAQGLAGVRAGVAQHVFRRATGHHVAASVAAFGA
jgi:hypothetical protein